MIPSVTWNHFSSPPKMRCPKKRIYTVVFCVVLVIIIQRLGILQNWDVSRKEYILCDIYQPPWVPGRPGQHIIGSSDIQVQSAFYNDKPPNKFVRIIAVLSNNTLDDIYKENLNIYCHIWLKATNYAISVPAEVETLSNQFQGLFYYFALVSCKVPAMINKLDRVLHDPVPSSVSLVTNVCGISINYMESVHRVNKNKNPDIAMCSRLTTPSLDPVWFIEWVELNRLFGVQIIYLLVYVPTLTDPLVDAIKYYEEQGVICAKYNTFAETISKKVNQHYTPNKRSEQNLELELVLLNECLYTIKEKYSLNIASDEIVQPPSGSDLTEFIAQLRMTEASMIKFKTAIFTKEFGRDKSNDSSPGYLHTMQYKTRTRLDSVTERSLINTELCKMVDHSQCRRGVTKVLTKSIQAKHGYVRHYLEKCSLHEQPSKCAKLIKEKYVDTSLDEYKWTLMEKVYPILRNCNLVPS